MRKFNRFFLRIFTAGVLIFCAAPGCKGDQEMITMVALGDSTTAGTPAFFSPREMPPDGRGDPESQYAYWAMLGHPEWNILNRGVRGQRSDQIKSRFDYDVKKENPQILIVVAGVNDVYQGYSESHIRENLAALYRLAEDAGIRVMACTILPFDIATFEQNQKIQNINRWIRETARQNGYGFCDTYAALEDPLRPGKLKSTYDQIHPDVDGYRLMGEAVAEALKKWI